MTAFNRFAPTLNALETRDVPAAISINNLPDGAREVVITGNATDEIATINDTGNGQVSVTATAAPPTQATNVRLITVRMNGGNDTVRYNLEKPLEPGRTMRLDVQLDSSSTGGNDRFEGRTANGAGLMEKAVLDIAVTGGRGNDTLSFTGSNMGIAVNADARITLAGDSGNDTIAQQYTGETDGRLGMVSQGGDGSDTIRQMMTFAVGSTGTGRGTIAGGLGTDALTLFVTPQPTMTGNLFQIIANDDGNVLDNVTFGGPVVVV